MNDNRTFTCNFNNSEEENVELARQYEAKAKELHDKLQLATNEVLNFLNLKSTHDNRARLLDYINVRGGAVRFVKTNYEWRKRSESEKAEKERKEKEAAELAINNELMQGRAIHYLLDHGKKFGLDFGLTNAIAMANDVAYDIAVKEHQQADTIYDFAGSDSCEDCAGWDGESHRCQCGNRRVYWAADGDFTNMTLYAEAY